MGKYGPEKTPYLDTFHAVLLTTKFTYTTYTTYTTYNYTII